MIGYGIIVMNGVLFGILGLLIGSLGLGWQDWQLWATLIVGLGIFTNGAFLGYHS